MPRLLPRLCLMAGVFLLATSVFAAPATSNPKKLLQSLSKVAPTLDTKVLNHAILAMQCAVRHGASPARRLAVIDYSLPSTEQRLWIFDLSRKKLLLRDLVAHGQASGENNATRFSNYEGSHQSSLGLFRTQESYYGTHGYSLRMDGLEPGFNDRARDRALVIHAADYVDPEWIPRQGRIGRSQGCPAVRPEIARKVVDSLKDGQFMFSWYPDEEWLQNSAFLNCPTQPHRVAGTLAHPRRPGDDS